jgi:hypothetical protein
MGDIEQFKMSMEEVTADCVEISREQELEVDPDYGTEVLPCHDTALTGENLLSQMNKESDYFS